MSENAAMLVCGRFRGFARGKEWFGAPLHTSPTLRFFLLLEWRKRANYALFLFVCFFLFDGKTETKKGGTDARKIEAPDVSIHTYVCSPLRGSEKHIFMALDEAQALTLRIIIARAF